MSMSEVDARHPEDVDLDRLIGEADTGGRNPAGIITRQILLWVAVAWSLFQLWYASPLPFILGFGVLNDTEARAIHLGFGIFLAFVAYPAFKSSSREKVPALDWAFALAGAFAGSYLFLFYDQLALRPGQPTTLDLVSGTVGIILLLEATRRSLGIPMVIVAAVFIFYTFAGQYMPEVIQHRGASLNKFLNHQWLTTEGVFGIALGVSTTFVFLFVLFGTLLEKAGAGNWLMQISVALLGHMRGGPAKVAVVSSALNGVVSGSSVSNVVTGGIFTIPMMKRTGLSGVKAGAIEASASINGQIMPPVMGAAAFLMVEYVGIPYSEIVKHALLPALFSYFALLYIVHLEAVKIGAKGIPAEPRPTQERLIRWSLGLSGSIVVIGALYYAILGIQAAFGAAAPTLLALLGAGLYVAAVWYSSRYPDLEMDDPNAPILHLPRAWEVTRTGLDFLIPIGVLLWCLMVEQLSPGLSAYWATISILGIVMTRRLLMALFRRQDMAAALGDTWRDAVEGLALGARNMIGIAVATATAGIVVGTITLTGLGLMMTELVEFISGGNVIIMLLMVAAISLVLGLGIPTTANYILVASLMAPVVVELAAQNGLAIPLIAVHLFVFYFGIMADITPPVGLAGFAAAAISREDPIATSFQGALYSMRTAILPFVFIFNPTMLLIGVEGWGDLIWNSLISLAAILLFSAATMNWFVTKSRLWESAVLLLVCFTLFRPDWWVNQMSPPFEEAPASEFLPAVGAAPVGSRITFVVEGIDLMGDDVRKTLNIPIRTDGDPAERQRAIGLTLAPAGDTPTITGVAFGSYAKRIGLDVGYEIVAVLRNTEQPSQIIPIGLALAATGGVAGLQFMRLRRQRTAASRERPA